MSMSVSAQRMNVKLPKYGTDMVSFAKDVLPTLDGQEKDDMVKRVADAFSGFYAPKPSPSMSAGARLSQMGNGIWDWFGYYGSPANQIPMDTDKIDEGFQKACQVLKTPRLVHQFYCHHYAYKADKVLADEWKSPYQVFSSRWSGFPNENKIADDCEGSAGFAQYSIMKANGRTPEQIIADFQRGQKNNVILGIYSANQGHATDLNGEWTICNFGLVRHGTTDIVKIGRNFLSDANQFSLYLSRNGEYDYIEGGDADFYGTGMSAQEYVATRGSFAVMTAEMLDKALKQGSVVEGRLEFKSGILGLTDEARKRLQNGLNMELKQSTPLHKIMVNRLDKQVKAVKIA